MVPRLHLLCVRNLFLKFLETQLLCDAPGPHGGAIPLEPPVPGTVAIPEDGLVRPYPGAALLSSVKSLRIPKR